MAKLFFLTVATSLLLSAPLVRADGYDQKSEAAAQTAAEIRQANEHARMLKSLTGLNNQILGRVPGYAVITKCVSEHAYFESNRQMTDWNGIPLEIGQYDDFNRTGLPPQIFSCHYHVDRTGKDCAVTAGDLSNSGRYTGITTTCY